MRVRLDHVQIAAPPGCEDEARRFFGDLIGLSEVEKPEPLRERGGVWFAVGDRQLHVGVEVGFTPAIKAHPPFSLPGVRRFYCRDPWGNRLEFIADGS